MTIPWAMINRIGRNIAMVPRVVHGANCVFIFGSPSSSSIRHLRVSVEGATRTKIIVNICVIDIIQHTRLVVEIFEAGCSVDAFNSKVLTIGLVEVAGL